MTDSQVQSFAFYGIILVYSLVGISLGILVWTNRKFRKNEGKK